MLITGEKIPNRFSKNLKGATEIDIATAWMTPNRGLCALQRRKPSPRVRAVVGLSDNITDPDALRTLAGMRAELSTPYKRRQRFHSKVYIFRSAEKSIAWIGSANFTCRGFGGNEKVPGNEEALFETSDTKAVEC